MYINLFLNVHLTFNLRIFLPDVFEFLPVLWSTPTESLWSCFGISDTEACAQKVALEPGLNILQNVRKKKRNDKKRWSLDTEAVPLIPGEQSNTLNSEQRPLHNSQEARAPTGANRRHIRGSHVMSKPKSKRSPWKVITSTEQQAPVKLCCTFRDDTRQD